MTIPSNWTKSDVDPARLIPCDPIAKAFGWYFYEHPQFGDAVALLAVRPGTRLNADAAVYDTHDFDVPDFL